MKQLLFLAVLMAALTVRAQKRFDSAAYVSFNQARWEKVNFAELMAEKPGNESLTAEQKIAGLSKCWAEARYNFANFDLVPQLQWDSLYTAFIPKVVATTSTLAYYKVLQNFYLHLRDGHTAVMLPYHYRKALNGRLPLQVRWIENKAVVVSNAASTVAEKAIKPGDELVAINQQPLQAYIQHHVSPYLHFSTPQDSTDRIYRYELFRAKTGEQWTLTFRTSSGKTLHVPFTFQAAELLAPTPLLQFDVLPGNIGYVQLNSFGSEKIVQQFDSIFPALSQTTSLIIDVRTNGGGNGGNGFEILGYLTGQPFYTGKTIIRQYRPVGRSWQGVENSSIEEDDWKPYKNKVYTKPVVVLTSGATYSAAEDFTATFKTMKRGLVIGEPTGGSTGQPVFFTLPGGGTGYVCAKRDFFSDGTEFVGIGIQPDRLVRPTLAGIAAGKDDVLHAAITYLQAQQ